MYKVKLSIKGNEMLQTVAAAANSPMGYGVNKVLKCAENSELEMPSEGGKEGGGVRE